MKLCALSVDLDEIPCYHAIHGLPAAEGPSAHAVYERAVPRFRELLRQLGVPCTFFVIGRDMDHPAAFAQARALVDEGHELGNHTQNHRYDLTRLDRDAMRDEVRLGAEAIARAQGFKPSGFRAPGYTTTDALLDVLSDEGVFYDSSVFPCPAYWAAKTAAIGLIAARGRTSRSIVDTPAVLAAPADPYFPSRPYWTALPSDGPMIELPIGVTRYARLPFIGTSVMMAGPDRVKYLTALTDGRPLVNLEMHGIDVLDVTDGLDALLPHQPDVRVPVERKLRTLRAVVEDLQRRGYAFVTLHDAAQAFEARARS